PSGAAGSNVTDKLRSLALWPGPGQATLLRPATSPPNAFAAENIFMPRLPRNEGARPLLLPVAAHVPLGLTPPDKRACQLQLRRLRTQAAEARQAAAPPPRTLP